MLVIKFDGYQNGTHLVTLVWRAGGPSGTVQRVVGEEALGRLLSETGGLVVGFGGGGVVSKLNLTKQVDYLDLQRFHLRARGSNTPLSLGELIEMYQWGGDAPKPTGEEGLFALVGLALQLSAGLCVEGMELTTEAIQSIMRQSVETIGKALSDQQERFLREYDEWVASERLAGNWF